MTAVPIALLDRPPTRAPEPEEVPEIGAPPIGPNEFELIPDTDTLITACNCSASSDNPYN
jgi:hypothetical protein